MNPMYNILRRIVFWVGDTRRIRHFPWITWDVKEHKIDLNEVDHAKTFLQEGDIILHRDDGFISNIFIGGAMIHAGIYVGNGQVIEAISEGVKERNAGHILYSDRAIILRPEFKIVDKQNAISEALDWAERITDFPYDCLFNFCSDEDRKLIKEYGDGAIKYGVKFCCTEIPHFCYFKYIDYLEIKKRRNINFLTKIISLCGLHPGEKVVDADMYVKAKFKIIWASKEFTPQWAEKMKCGKEYVDKLTDYWLDRIKNQ